MARYHDCHPIVVAGRPINPALGLPYSLARKSTEETAPAINTELGQYRESGATFSEDRIYRHCLWRRFVPGCPGSRMVAFIGLNPSKAAEIDNDPTVKRWIGFAKSWGYEGFAVLNAFDLVETDRLAMKRHSMPLSAANDSALVEVTVLCGLTVSCWGADGIHRNRSARVSHLLQRVDLYCFRLTKFGQPEHPLYLPGDLKPKLWKAAEQNL